MNLRHLPQSLTTKCNHQSRQGTTPMTTYEVQCPEGRLCRIVNVASGTLLDHTVDRESNIIIGSPAANASIKNWRVVPLGPGYAIRTAEDVAVPRYLAPRSEGTRDTSSLTLSTFPCSWELYKTDEYTTEGDRFGVDVVEEWVCAIRWPYHHDPKVLDLIDHGRGTNVVFFPLREPRHERCQFWRIQFLQEVPPYTPTTSPLSYSSVVQQAQNSSYANTDCSLESGAKYALFNVKGKTVIDYAWGDKIEDKVHGYQFVNAKNQVWAAVDTGDGWTFKNMGNDRYLSIQKDPGDGVKVVTCSDATLWDVQRQSFERKQGENVYRLVLSGTSYSLTLAGNGAWKNCTEIILWHSWPARHQTWRFEKVG